MNIVNLNIEIKISDNELIKIDMHYERMLLNL